MQQVNNDLYVNKGEYTLDVCVLSDVDVIDPNVHPVWHKFSPSLLNITPPPKKKTVIDPACVCY